MVATDCRQCELAYGSELPKRRIEYLPFFNQDFAPDDFISRRRVPVEVNAVDSELTVFINVYIQIHDPLLFIEIETGFGRKVDVSTTPVNSL